MARNNAKHLAIKLSIRLGADLQDSAYRLETAYTRGFSQAALAEHLKKMPEYAPYGSDVLAHAVRYYLIGNEDPQAGPVFKGRIPRDVYDEHSTKHRQESGKLSGLLRLREKRGIHALGSEELRASALKAAKSRGETPWTRKELSQVLGLALSEMFKMNGHVDYGSIARNLNDSFYNGSHIRSRTSTREALRRLQRSFTK